MRRFMISAAGAFAGVVLFTALPAAAHNSHGRPIELQQLGTYASGKFAVGAAEIVTYDALTRRAFVVNAADTTVDVLDVSDPSDPHKVASIDASALGGSANSIDARLGVLAVAIEANDKQANGVVAFYHTWDLRFLGSVEVGALPDMLTFTPDGRYVLVANEGEPNDSYTVDPPGSISVIDLHRGIDKATVRTAGFEGYNGKVDELRAKGVRVYGLNATVAQDFEPEYITIVDKLAYATLQENNAIAVIDIAKAKVIDILPLGFKDHSKLGNEFDPSDRDAGIAIANWPVYGIYEPDSIASYKSKGKTYLVTANEGDTRAYSAFNEEVRVGASSVKLDATVFPNATALKANAALGRLTITRTLGDTDNDGDLDALYVPGVVPFRFGPPMESRSSIAAATSKLLRPIYCRTRSTAITKNNPAATRAATTKDRNRKGSPWAKC